MSSSPFGEVSTNFNPFDEFKENTANNGNNPFDKLTEYKFNQSEIKALKKAATVIINVQKMTEATLSAINKAKDYLSMNTTCIINYLVENCDISSEGIA